MHVMCTYMRLHTYSGTCMCTHIHGHVRLLTYEEGIKRSPLHGEVLHREPRSSQAGPKMASGGDWLASFTDGCTTKLCCSLER